MADKSKLEAQRYYDVLWKIARGYDSSERLRKRAERDYGLSPEEAIEMAYDNVRGDAARVIKGKRRPPP